MQGTAAAPGRTGSRGPPSRPQIDRSSTPLPGWRAHCLGRPEPDDQGPDHGAKGEGVGQDIGPERTPLAGHAEHQRCDAGGPPAECHTAPEPRPEHRQDACGTRHEDARARQVNGVSGRLSVAWTVATAAG